MKTKHFFRLFSVAVLLMTVSSLSAQVTVGSDIVPNKAALFDLKTQQLGGAVSAVTDASNVTSTSGGLLLPRVQLVSSSTLQPFIEPADPEYTAEFKLRHAGLLVYNITNNSPLVPGIFIWTGIEWATYTTTVLPSSITAQPNKFTFYETGLGAVNPLVFTADGPGTWSYEWYRITGNNVHVRVGTKITSTTGTGNGAGYNSSSFTPNVLFGTTNNAANCGFYRFYCVATSTSGVRFESVIAEVAVGCGVKTKDDKWMSFMCFNLGAENDISIDQQINRPLIFSQANDANGLHIYTTNEENIYGSLFQWGRIADGHENRDNISNLSVDISGLISDSIVSGKTCYTPNNTDNRRPYYQVKRDTKWYGKFVHGSANWNTTTAGTGTVVLDQLWRTGGFIQNDPCMHYKIDGTYQDFWNDSPDNTDDGGLAYQPGGACQSANIGWRMPTQSEWGETFAGGVIFGSPGQATANTWQWVGTTDTAHGYKIMPDNTTTTLFLPANGYRNSGGGLLYDQGAKGYYWSSTVTGTNAYYLGFVGTVSPGNSSYRASGFALRCIRNT